MPSLSDLRKVANINTLDWELLEDECKDQEGDIWWYNLSYNFETIKGKVYIAGITSRPEQLEQVVEATRTVKGVNEIVNYVIVKE